MHHLAIMKKSWGLTPKIISGEKTIESRWYQSKRAPWGRIKKGDTIYFKNSGEPITVASKVAKVLSFSGLTPLKVREILNKYGRDDGIEKRQVPNFYKLFKNKKYCLLIYIKNPEEVEPFNVSKKGFGMLSAWLCVGDIHKIRVRG